MPDVFISYKREDEDAADRLRDELEKDGWDVWWDREIYAGHDWGSRIYEELGKAKAVVVLWSPRAVRSEWVRREAEAARDGKKYVPAVIEECELPPGFDEVEFARLHHWDAAPTKQGEATAELGVLKKGVAALVKPSRIDTVRPGYDPEFLGTTLRLPSVRGRAKELRYLHFSVVFNPVRSLAWYVAYNSALNKGERAERGRWQEDPLIPAEFQPRNEQFFRTEYDRGHLVSPYAVAWGDDRAVSIATRQANYWTNASPQLEAMNRKWWFQLEMWERAVVKDRGQTIGFAGPIFSDDDPDGPEITISEGRLHAIQQTKVPRRYWKVVVARASGEALECAAFCLDQIQLLDSGGLQEGIDSHRVALADLEEWTGLGFDEALHRAVPLLPT